jgi:hypothetical protein
MGEPTPLQDLLVNDRYWLGRARGMLDQSIRGRDEAAARLASGVGWLWTVYTGAALVGVALRDRPLPGWVVVLLVLPAVLLVAGYGLATWAQLPVDVSFDPRVVEEIRTVHTHATQVKQCRLRLAGVAAGLGALAVVGAVVATAVVHTGGSGPALMAVTQERPAGQVVVLVRGQFPAGRPVTLTVVAQSTGSPVSVLARADAGEQVRETIPVQQASGGYRVTAAWADHDQQWTITSPAQTSP